MGFSIEEQARQLSYMVWKWLAVEPFDPSDYPLSAPGQSAMLSAPQGTAGRLGRSDQDAALGLTRQARSA